MCLNKRDYGFETEGTGYRYNIERDDSRLEEEALTRYGAKSVVVLSGGPHG